MSGISTFVSEALGCGETSKRSMDRRVIGRDGGEGTLYAIWGLIYGSSPVSFFPVVYKATGIAVRACSASSDGTILSAEDAEKYKLERYKKDAFESFGSSVVNFGVGAYLGDGVIVTAGCVEAANFVYNSACACLTARRLAAGEPAGGAGAAEPLIQDGQNAVDNDAADPAGSAV